MANPVQFSCGIKAGIDFNAAYFLLMIYFIKTVIKYSLQQAKRF